MMLKYTPVLCRNREDQWQNDRLSQGSRLWELVPIGHFEQRQNHQ